MFLPVLEVEVVNDLKGLLGDVRCPREDDLGSAINELRGQHRYIGVSR